MRWITTLLGNNWPQRVIILGAIILYIYLGITRPEVAKEGVVGAGKRFVSLVTLIFAALLIGNAIRLLMPTDLVTKWLGKEAGIKGIIGSGLLGGIMQGGPYAVYPIIKSLYDKGAHISMVMAMLMGYGAIGLARVVYGLAIFSPQIVGLRLLFALPVPIITGLIVYFWM